MSLLVVTLTPPVGLLGMHAAVAAALPEIAEALKNEIVALAQRSLTSAGADYSQGLSVIHIPITPGARDAVFASVVLTGWLANAVENGWAGGDMKPALLSGRNAKLTADGKRYNVVPFRHGTPGSSDRSFAAMGSVHAAHGMDDAAAKQLGRQVWAAAKKLAPTTGTPGGKVKWGDRLLSGTAPKLTNRTTGYQHKTDIFAGMARVEKTYANATQNQYKTFRMVSDNSDPGAWVHPGIIRHDFFGKAAAKLPGIASLIFDGVVRGLNSGGR